MNLKQTLKAIVIGFCFGFGLTWLLAIIIPFTMGVSNIGKFIHDCSDDISSMSVLAGGISSVIWLALAAVGRKRRRREELEDAMTEYFRKQSEKED